MSLWDAIRGEFVDIVEWLDDSRDTLVWRFPRYDNEIKNGAQLVVRVSQYAVLVDQGQLADEFGPGTYTLETENLPILSKLRGWKYGFRSPFKAEVYFISTRQFTDQKWGTSNPITLRDPEFGMVRLRAFGNFSYRVNNPSLLLQELVGSNAHFTLQDIHDQLRALTVSRFTDALAESGVATLDLATRYDELGGVLLEKLQPEFARYGIELTQFLIGNISLPPEVEQAIDKRAGMSAVGNLNHYLQYQTAQSIETAAGQPGGNDALSLGAGFAMAEQLRQAFQPTNNASPPPLPTAVYHVAVAGQAQGPFDASALQAMAAAGTLTRDTLVWAPGMAKWTAAGQVTPLSLCFASLPPPLPPHH